MCCIWKKSTNYIEALYRRHDVAISDKFHFSSWQSQRSLSRCRPWWSGIVRGYLNYLKYGWFYFSLELVKRSPLISLPNDGVASLLTQVHHRGSKSGLLWITEPPIVTDESEVGVEAREFLHSQGALVIAQIGWGQRQGAGTLSTHLQNRMSYMCKPVSIQYTGCPSKKNGLLCS